MMKDPEMVSVIIPVHDGERYLGAAIESVLAQAYRPLEVIVVDDGSTDGSAAVARRFGPPVRYRRQAQSGAAAARNRGARLAQGGFIAFLDADDLWVENKLSRQMAVLQQDLETDMVFGHVEQFISPELEADVKEKICCPTGSLPGQHPGAMLVRRDAFFRVGSFETSWDIGEFVDWYARAVEMGLKGRMLPEVVMRRRLHTTNQGVLKPRDQRQDYVRILKAALDRRRQRKISGDTSPGTEVV